MLKRQRLVRAQIHKWVDAGLFSLSFCIAHALRAALGTKILFLGAFPPIQPFDEYAWLLLLIFPLTFIWLGTQGFYNRPMISSRRETFWQLGKACVLASVTIILVLFILREEKARAVIILFGAISFVLVFLKEEVVRHAMQTRLGQSQVKKRLILAGAKADRERLMLELRGRSRGSIEIAAEMDLSEDSVEKLVELLHETSANGVMLAAKHTVFDQIERVIQMCELEGVEVWLIADFFKTQLSRTTIDDLDGHPMLVFSSTPEASWQGVAKQLIDVVGAFIAIIFGSIIMVPVALLIKLTSPGPVLFKQQRSGLNGQPFTMLKFRSMVTNAEQLKHELAAMNEMGGPVFKVTNDPRVTRIGRIIRRWSIDEWPQFFNVLVGDMSLVGPRPLPVDETRRFDDLAHRRRLSMKPGLTCLWQISGRNDVKDFKDWVRLDLEYIDNWTIWLDVRILLLTLPAVVRGTGAK